MRRKREVFIYIHQGILRGGVEKVFYNILNNISQEKYHITVLSVMGYLKDDFESQLYPANVTRYCLQWDEFSSNLLKRLIQKLHNRLFPKLFTKWLKLKKFDVAIAAQEGFYARFVEQKVRARKKLLWVHNDIEKCHWSISQFNSIDDERNTYRSFNNIICVSEDVRRSMINVFGKLDNLVVCYNPIDTNEIDLKLHECIPPRPFESTCFVCIGRLAHQKGYDRLLNVCSRLNKEGFKYHITIVGEGEDRHNLENKIKELRLDNIDLVGNQSNPFVWMKMSDWLLLPSRHEGFGMVLHESVYCETPVIATDVCGVRELLCDNKYGIIVENNEEMIYEGIKKVLSSPDLLNQYRGAVKKRKSFVNLENRINQIEMYL